MSRRACWYVLLLCVGALSLSCKGCKGTPNNDALEVPGGEFGEVLSAMCGTLDRCPGAFGAAIAYRSRDECAAILNFAMTCRLTETEIDDDRSIWGVERREPNVDGTNLDACKQWLASTPCDQLERTSRSSPCGDVLDLNFDDDGDDEPRGHAGIDEACEDDDDCRPELFCTGGQSDEAQGIHYCRVCRERAGQGDDCRDARCAAGLYCKSEDDGTTARCAAPEADGFRCYADEQCASGWCNTSLEELGGWGQCDAGGKLGDPCVDELRDDGSVKPTCRAELHCDDGTCQARVPNGGACPDAYACVQAACTEGTCGVPDGSPCSWDGECATELCIDGICGLHDDKCLLDEHCAPGEFCAGACQPPNCECSGCPVGTCTPSGQGGCQDDSDCGTGECNDGVCSAGPQLGDACTQTYECYPVGQCVNNVCVEKSGPGEACTALDGCVDPFLCVEGTCQIMNLTCEPARAGRRCTWLRVCDDSSWCDLFDGVTCKPRARLGAECETTLLRDVETCMPGSTCTYDEASGTNRCVALPKLGEPCTGQCDTGSFCFGGVCQGDPVGRRCDYDNPCPSGLRCHDDLEVCAPPAAVGESCRDTVDCADGLFCERYDSCQPRKSAGAECNDTSECARELHCSRDTWTCTADLPAGAECSSSEEECAEGFFCDSGACTLARAPGADCSSNEECLSGFCYSYSFCAAQAECTLP